jgi:hypothetical protein
VAKGWRKLLHYLFSSSNIIRVIKSSGMRLGGYVGLMVEMRNAYKIFVGKHERKKPLGRPKPK